jgi:septal ring factor EnvC (AmiA/AmiB activator)
MLRGTLILVLLCAAFAAMAEPPDPSEQEQELEALRAEIDQVRRRSDALATDEEQQLARIHAIEREVALTKELLGRLGEKEATIRSRIDSLQHDMDGLRDRIDGRRDRLGQRLRAIYMRPRTSVVATVLSADDLDELGTRLRAMTHLARTERALIGEVQDAQAALRHRRGRLAKEMAEINLTRSEAEDRRIQLESLQGERGQALSRVRAERARFDASLQEMERAAAQMEELLVRLQSERAADAQGTTGFGSLGGKLPWPVTGRILKPFGRSVHPEFGTVVMNKGINIGAPAGTPIQCVAEGRVEYVDWLPGYGRCIIVDHGDGYYTLYAHASSIFPSVGTVVHAGEVLGEVGDTGSLNGSQLYFEIRKGKDSLDPTAWLSRRRG